MTKRRASELLREARRALDAGRAKQAIEACTAALELDPGSADAFELRGVAFEDRKRLREAIADYSAALRLRPGVGELHHNRGFARMRCGDAAGASRDFSAALRSAALRDDPDLLLARASCRLEVGKLTGAHRDVVRLIEVLEAEQARHARELAPLGPRPLRSFLLPARKRLAEAEQLRAKIERARAASACE